MTLGVGAILRSEPAPIVRRLVFATKEAALPEHADLFAAMARVNLAHVAMLHDERLVPPDVAARLARFLLDAFHGGPSSLALAPEGGDLYPQIEACAAKALGHHVAGFLQLGRSRGDVIPAAMRLKLRTRCLRVLRAMLPLRERVLALVDSHAQTMMPSYTHWQQSQIMSFGHFLGRFAAWFERDFERLLQCVERHDLSPLGAANGVGTSVALDRDATARLLAHTAPVPSAGDATNAWDYMIEPISHLALFTANASRLACNLILWHTREFGMVSLSDAFATASTYLPQKRNPEPLETVKFFAESVAGDLAAVYLFARNEDWPHSLINHGFGTINRAMAMGVDSAELMTALLEDLRVNEARMAELAGGGFVTASEVANSIVRECGLPFREAHEVVGTAVRLAMDGGAERLSVADIRQAARQFLGHDLQVADDALERAADPARFLERMASPGGTQPAQTRRLASHWRERLQADRARLRDIDARIEQADARLLARAGEIAASSRQHS